MAEDICRRPVLSVLVPSAIATRASEEDKESSVSLASRFDERVRLEERVLEDDRELLRPKEKLDDLSVRRPLGSAGEPAESGTFSSFLNESARWR